MAGVKVQEIEVPAGVYLRYAISQAIELAKVNNCTIQFNFNGKLITVRGYDSIGYLVDKYSGLPGDPMRNPQGNMTPWDNIAAGGLVPVQQVEAVQLKPWRLKLGVSPLTTRPEAPRPVRKILLDDD